MTNDRTNALTIDAPALHRSGMAMGLGSMCMHRASVNVACGGFAAYRVVAAGWQGAANPAIASVNTRKRRPLGRCGTHRS